MKSPFNRSWERSCSESIDGASGSSASTSLTLEKHIEKPGRIVTILFLGVLVTALDIAILAPALRSIGAYFGVEDERSLSWVFIIYTLFTQVGIPFMTWLSDAYGRRNAFTLCLGLFTIGKLIVVFSTSFDMLLIGRAIQGLGVSGIVPITSTVIGDIFPVEKRGRMLGIIGAVFGLAFIIGPIMSAFLISYGWQWPFAVLIPVAFLVWGLAWFRLPTGQKRMATRLDLWGIILLVGFITCITIGVSRLETEQIGESLMSMAVLPFLIAAVLTFGAFVGVEKNKKNPFVRFELFESRQISIACWISMGAGMAEAVFVFLPSFAFIAFSVTDRMASMMLMPLVLALAIGAPVIGRLIDRIGARIIVQAGSFLVAVGMGLLSVVTNSVGMYYLGIVLIGLGLSALLGSAISYILLNEALEAERTVVQGLSRLFKGFGRLIGGALIGAVVASAAIEQTGYNRAFLIIAIAAGLFHLLSYGLSGKKTAQLDGRLENMAEGLNPHTDRV